MFAMLLGVSVASATGCQKSQAAAIQKIPVQGTVTLDGKPLEGAEVIFTTPLLSTFTAETGADGSFQLSSAAGGPAVCDGLCKVTVSKFVMPPGKTAQPNMSPQLQGARQVIPPRYSDALYTTLSVTVPEGGGKFDFPLTGQ
ncbi:MAG TPA: hypothetical protein VG826_09265 [Pirellulales bacterium]|nr:hypothetical protein [Pirellulales bacterium]